MPRLRTTTALSLLALVVGVLGTGWLSERTESWPAASSAALATALPRPVRARHVRSLRLPASSSQRPKLAVLRRAPAAQPPAAVATAMPAAPTESTEPVSARTLVPVSTPAGATPYERLRGHLQGRVLLQVVVGGDGRVRRAAVARSSGDPLLDQHALEIVQGWRFAVPVDHPDGVSGTLPMRFDTGASLAGTPP